MPFIVRLYMHAVNTEQYVHYVPVCTSSPTWRTSPIMFNMFVNSLSTDLKCIE